MALKSNVGQWAGNLRRMAQALPDAQRQGVMSAAEAVRRGVLTTARARGARAKESWVTITEQSAAGQPAALLQLRGSRAYWAQRGTKPHAIVPKSKQALRTPEGPRASAVVRGVKPKRFWEPGVQSAQAAAQQAMMRAVRDALRSR